MERKTGLPERLLNGLDLMEESMPGEPLTEIAGHRRVFVENHRGVTECGLCCIRIRVRFGEIVVAGSHLELARMTGRQIVVTGIIDSVTFQRRG